VRACLHGRHLLCPVPQLVLGLVDDDCVSQVADRTVAGLLRVLKAKEGRIELFCDVQGTES
jgi:hypothetical protein